MPETWQLFWPLDLGTCGARNRCWVLAHLSRPGSILCKKWEKVVRNLASSQWPQAWQLLRSKSCQFRGTTTGQVLATFQGPFLASWHLLAEAHPPGETDLATFFSKEPSPEKSCQETSQPSWAPDLAISRLQMLPGLGPNKVARFPRNFPRTLQVFARRCLVAKGFQETCQLFPYKLPVLRTNQNVARFPGNLFWTWQLFVAKVARSGTIARKPGSFLVPQTWQLLAL